MRASDARAAFAGGSANDVESARRQLGVNDVESARSRLRPSTHGLLLTSPPLVLLALVAVWLAVSRAVWAVVSLAVLVLCWPFCCWPSSGAV